MKTCIIICNGTGLNDIPNSFLSQYPTFGSNRIYMRYIPNYYACISKTVLDQVSDEIAGMRNCIKFIRDSHPMKDAHPLHCSKRGFFSFEPLKEISEGWTVTYALMQLAYYYGFERVGIVGMDHYYGEFDATKKVIKGQDDFHFSPQYFKGLRCEAPNLAKSDVSYRRAKRTFEADGRKIVNLSTLTYCETFERENWRSWM